MTTNSNRIRWGRVLAVPYFLCVVVSLVYMHIMAPATAFCGIYALIVTMPWSLLLTLLIAAINPTLFDSMVPGTVILFLSGIFNTLLLYYGPDFISKRNKSKNV